MVSAIVLAAGSGQRMGADLNKVYLELAGRPLLVYALEAFQEHPLVDEVILVYRLGDEELLTRVLAAGSFSKVRKKVPGGDQRMDSVVRGLNAADPLSQWVLIHDAARPLVSQTLISRCLEATMRYGAACPVLPVKDTISRSCEQEMLGESLDRSTLRAMQTPQGFHRPTYEAILEKTRLERRVFTDDSSLFHWAGRPVKLFEGASETLKVTTPEDLCLCEFFLLQRQGGKGPQRACFAP
ncbi:2-C-methyl-D-erythritol 4-phosphate cytidylyltransferase [Clostridiaceae bacterium JG1575]|nr:2-C-methyl-D-erythritol 4-phosphate cytidylyltransferase [Clostridiaceae bacterium JG1575]